MAITSVPAGTITPNSTPTALASNYLDFAAGTSDWAQQYLPELMEKEAEIFGNRTLSGFLSQVGAEEAMAADQVIWAEQGRLHMAFNGTSVSGGNGGTITITTDIDGNNYQTGSTRSHPIRKGDMVLISDSTTTTTAYVEGINSAVATNTIDVGTYTATTLINAGIADGAVTVLVFGSEYVTGQAGRDNGNDPAHKTYGNQPIILKDMYDVSGSDAAHIGWVEISGEEGQSGYLWYLKAEGDTRARFTDYLEMSMLEAEKVSGTTLVDYQTSGIAPKGTEGLFAAIKARGNQSTGITGVNAATDLSEFDLMLAEFDSNGAIEENMMFVDRSTSLAIDDMLASMNSYGAGGTSYGVFSNSEDMALNLGFSGFRRGSYDFYKSDWKYLNDKAGRGAMIDTVTNVRGVVVPAGTSSVYDQTLGKNMKRPFLHVRYRASQTESRRLKTWITGSVGGAVTSDLDAMEVHYLSERCLVTQGANNFMLLN